MIDPKSPSSTDTPATMQQVATVEQLVTYAQGHASSQKAAFELASKDAVISQEVQSYKQKKWWFHLRALFEREFVFFRRIRETNAPVISQLEDLFRQAKEHTDELVHAIPRDIEQMAEEYNFPLDRAKSGHPKYRFRDGFLTLEIDSEKRIARLSDYEEKLFTMPPDIEAIADAIKLHDQRLFGRPFDGAKFLKIMRRNYLAILKKSKKPDGDPVPLRHIYRRLADKGRRFRRDEFLIDLSKLVREGPPTVEGYRFELQQTKDTEQGFMLYGPSARGMVNLLIFRKATP